MAVLYVVGGACALLLVLPFVLEYFGLPTDKWLRRGRRRYYRRGDNGKWVRK